MSRPAVVVAAALVLVLSGCVGAAEPGAIGQSFSADPDNHWGEQVLTVSYEAPADDTRDYRPLVQQALVYWTEHSEAYAGFDVGFRLAEPGEAADVHVSFVEEVGECGDAAAGSTAGCAPVITKHSQISRPVEIEVQTGLSDRSTVRVLEHELGHTLGLTHGDAPEGVMAGTIELSTLPTRNASERAMPWESENLAVYVDAAGAPAEERDAVEQRVDAVLEYYAEGADGTVPSEVTFSAADSPAAADVVVRYARSDDCRSDAGSCGTVTGEDPDGDGAPEYYDRLEVVLVDLEPDAVGWHVGRWLGTSFGHDAPGQYPAPLRRSADAEDRRSDWWN